MDQARERQLAAARPAAERVGRLEHRHFDTLGGEGEAGSEPVGPAADDDRPRHDVTSGCFGVADTVAGLIVGVSMTAGAWLTRS